jgi:ankyrin repeat protein
VRDQATTRFFLACELGDTSAVQSALRADPSFVRVRNGSGWTPLIVAAFNQQRDTVRVLLDFGADVNAIGNNGTSVFMYAKTRVLNRPDEDYGLLQLLVDRGADLSSTDSRGLSVLDYVRQAGDQRLANWIQSKRD